ncbi:MAG: hypothetical protein PHN64_04010 [Desulfovibrionaceae bacterium]|nr:hypothetical protein [Desulfovibrionaceae bacterium]
MDAIKITPEVLAYIEKKAKAATPGVWYPDGGGMSPTAVRTLEKCVCQFISKDDDAAYIAAASPGVVLALIAELRRLKLANAMLRMERTTTNVNA